MAIITDYYFQKATYLIRDKHGNELLLKNNYMAKKFKIVPKVIKNSKYETLRSEVSRTAMDLLERKHAVNFAYKFG